MDYSLLGKVPASPCGAPSCVAQPQGTGDVHDATKIMTPASYCAAVGLGLMA